MRCLPIENIQKISFYGNNSYPITQEAEAVRNAWSAGSYYMASSWRIGLARTIVSKRQITKQQKPITLTIGKRGQEDEFKIWLDYIKPSLKNTTQASLV